MFIYRFLILSFLMFFMTACGGTGSDSESEKIAKLVIQTENTNWGNVNPVDVKAVALSAGNEVLKNIPGVILNTIIIKNKIPSAPITLFDRGTNNEYIIGVKIDGTYWAQLSYQFSHELMHVITNYGNTKNDPNQWFEEAVCEAASIQAIKDMSVSWQTKPPYPNFKSYSASLASYYQGLVTEDSRYLAQGDSIAAWYLREKNSLRSDPGQRDKNEVIGTQLFYFLNEKPERWKALRYLNIGNFNGSTSLQQYLDEWEAALPSDLKYVAVTISSWFGY